MAAKYPGTCGTRILLFCGVIETVRSRCPMNRRQSTRICGYIILTGGMLALGAAFGQIGLIISGVIMLIISWTLFNESSNYPKAGAEEAFPLHR